MTVKPIFFQINPASTNWTFCGDYGDVERSPKLEVANVKDALIRHLFIAVITNSNSDMKTQIRILLIVLTLGVDIIVAEAQGTAFTYQGRLNDGANPATGTYDLRFAIYDSTNNPGVLIAGPVTNAATSVSNGLFTVALDFGSGVFNGAPRFLDIAVRTNGGVSFVALIPRQAIWSGRCRHRSYPAFIATP
jgi:hypothetical protein